MAIKKGKKSNTRDYSAAAKKGWKTRRRNIRIAKTVERARYMGKLPKEKRNPKAVQKLENDLNDLLLENQAQKKRIKELEKENKKRAKEEKARLRRLKLRKGHEKFQEQRIVEDGVVYVNPLPLEYLHRDGTVAAEPSILRHLNDTPKIIKRIQGLVDREVEAHGATADLRDLHDDFVQIANEYEVEVREVYTLYFSE